jgi:hypothetical protein
MSEAIAEQSTSSIDVTTNFRSMIRGGDVMTLLDELREVRRVPELTIAIHWSELIENPTHTQGYMRWLKSFLESKPTGQRRTATIFGTYQEREAAAKIEANVLNSGVRWEFTDEPTPDRG